MKKTALTALVLVSIAVAQQTAKVMYTPATIDGVTTPNALVTINGKQYVSVDALKARGLNVLKSGSFGLFHYPIPNKPAIKLAGCAGEWLHNGVNRVRFERPVWDEKLQWWTVPLTLQTPLYNRSFERHFDLTGGLATFQSGYVLQTTKDALGTMSVLGAVGDPGPGENNPGTLVLRNPNFTAGDAPTKLVLGTFIEGAESRPFSVNLTCQK